MAKSKKEVAEAELGGDPYLKEILALIPEEKKDTILSALGEKIMPRQDYSRAMDEIRNKETAVLTYKESLDRWWGENTQKLDEYEKLKSKASADPAPSGGSDTLKALEGYIKKDEVDKLVNERLRQSEENGLNLFPSMMEIATKHLSEYGQVINPNEIIAHARSKNLSMRDAYMDLSKDLREEKAKKAEEARVAKMREELRQELMKEQGHGIFPVSPDSGVSSGLAGLKAEIPNTSSRISAAIEDHFKNGATRRSAS